MAIGGILSGFCFACIGPLAKKFDERVLLLVGGIIPMILGPDHPYSLSRTLHHSPSKILTYSIHFLTI